MNKKKPDVTIVPPRGNVFAQLGLPNPEERLFKAKLMGVVNQAIQRENLTQYQAAEKAGVDQADISRIAHGQGARYSLERLFAIAARLGLDIEVIQRHDVNGEIIVEVKELV
jgi:predicted XRE-type DNA-binding protein